MPHGLWVADPSSNVILDSSKLIGRLVGSTVSSASTGNLTDNAFLTGTPFVIPICDFNIVSGDSRSAAGPSYTLPSFTYSSNVASWSRPSPPSGEASSSCEFFFGVF